MALNEILLKIRRFRKGDLVLSLFKEETSPGFFDPNTKEKTEFNVVLEDQDHYILV